MKKQIRFVSIILCIATILTLLCSCSQRPLAQGKLAGTVVGTVTGGSEKYEIYYEEFYPLAQDYYKIAKAKYGNDKDKINAEVWDSLYEKIIINSAILELCASEGLKYDESALRDRVNQFLETEATANFDGTYDQFIDAQEEAGFTDHYLRFCIGVEFLYHDLAIEYQKNGTIPNTDAKIEKYIKENFLHTWHIAIYVDENDDRDAEYERAKEALAALKDGTSMFELIGGKYNEDTNLETLKGTYGNYFQKDVCPWGEDYEKAASTLKENKAYDSIITTTGISPSSGETVECFYIIERLPILNTEIQDNFEELSDTVINSILSKNLDEKLKALKFEPNDYAKNLDLANLEKPTNGIDYQLVIAICVSICAIILLICAIFIFRVLRAKRFQNKLKKSKTNAKNKKK